MINMLKTKGFFDIDSYCSNGYFDKEAFAESHRVIDVCCNSGVLLEVCYNNFMSIFGSNDYQFCFNSMSEA